MPSPPFSQFNLVYGSDIWNNPKNYGITEIITDESSDLPGIVFNFKGEGMTRKEAVMLRLNFNDQLSQLNYICSQKEFIIHGKSQRINFDLNKITETIFDYCNLTQYEISKMEKIDYSIKPNKGCP